MSESTETNTSITIRRTINAPRQRVFDAWTQPEQLMNWWRVSPAMHTVIAEVDLKVGGKYRLGMRDPEQAGPFTVGGEFVEITRPERLVYTWSWETPGMYEGETLVTVEFIEKGEATELVLTHERFANAEVASKHNEGWCGCLAHFVNLVAPD